MGIIISIVQMKIRGKKQLCNLVSVSQDFPPSLSPSFSPFFLHKFHEHRLCASHSGSSWAGGREYNNY